MAKTLVKFQKNRYKTVGGCVPTRYPLSIHIVIGNARKMTKFILRKSDKNNLGIIIQTTCISSDHDQNTSDVSKESV